MLFEIIPSRVTQDYYPEDGTVCKDGGGEETWWVPATADVEIEECWHDSSCDDMVKISLSSGQGTLAFLTLELKDWLSLAGAVNQCFQDMDAIRRAVREGRATLPTRHFGTLPREKAAETP